jgi:hypothetical protein
MSRQKIVVMDNDWILIKINEDKIKGRKKHGTKRAQIESKSGIYKKKCTLWIKRC